jgi:hypothetical protein
MHEFFLCFSFYTAVVKILVESITKMLGFLKIAIWLLAAKIGYTLAV